MKTFTKIAALGLALSMSAAAFSQDFAATGPGGGTISGGAPGPDDILWDNTAINNTTNGIISNFLGGIPGQELVNVADDFSVPADEIWTVTFVYSEGFTNAPSNVDSFDVIIYDDAGGVPGSIVSQQSVPFGGLVTMTTQELTLPTPVDLGGGTYWVSIVGVYNTGADLAVTRWNWTTGATGIGIEAQLQNFTPFFGGTLPWTPLSGLGVTEPSTFFVIRGTSAPAFQIQQVPTLDTWALIVMMMAFLGAATVLVRRSA
ncbi:MAG: hypothetical protein AAGJ52_09860 [Pseudomonadota bacterium]